MTSVMGGLPSRWPNPASQKKKKQEALITLKDKVPPESALFGERGARAVVCPFLHPSWTASCSWRWSTVLPPHKSATLPATPFPHPIQWKCRDRRVHRRPPRPLGSFAGARTQTMNPKLAYADDHFHDECGVFGVFGHPEASNLTSRFVRAAASWPGVSWNCFQRWK